MPLEILDTNGTPSPIGFTRDFALYFRVFRTTNGLNLCASRRF